MTYIIVLTLTTNYFRTDGSYGTFYTASVFHWYILTPIDLNNEALNNVSVIILYTQKVYTVGYYII